MLKFHLTRFFFRNPKRKYFLCFKSQIFFFQICNVLKSGTLLSATPENHSQSTEWRRSATLFYQKEWCGSGTHFFEESENMSGPLLSLFFFWNFLFSDIFFQKKNLFSMTPVVYIFLEAKVFSTWHKISCKLPIKVP